MENASVQVNQTTAGYGPSENYFSFNSDAHKCFPLSKYLDKLL